MGFSSTLMIANEAMTVVLNCPEPVSTVHIEIIFQLILTYCDLEHTEEVDSEALIF